MQMHLPGMLSTCILSLAGLLLYSAPATGQAGSTASNEDAAIRAVVDTLIRPQLAADNAPGAIVGISVHGRRHFYAYGNARDDGSPFTPDTLVEIGSCTKVFTTTLFALAIDRHQIQPDASIAGYMPRGTKLQPGAQQVTPRELALFTSGLPDDPPNLPRQLEMRSIDFYTTKDFFRWISQWSPDGPLPAPYLYSNAGAGLLGYLVAEATRVPWDQQLQQEITGPLGMPDTLVRPSGNQMNRMAQGHRVNGNPAPPWPVFAWFAGGALRSTAADMLRFGEANLLHPTVDGKGISPELTQAMKLAQAPVYLLPNGEAKQGMAWVTNLGNQPGLAPEVLKNGGTVGFSSVILLNPTKDAAIFIAVNQSGVKPAQLAVKIGRQLP